MNRRSNLRFAPVARLTTLALLGLPLLLAASAPGTAPPHTEVMTFDPARIVIEPAATGDTGAVTLGPVGIAMRVRYPAIDPGAGRRAGPAAGAGLDRGAGGDAGRGRARRSRRAPRPGPGGAGAGGARPAQRRGSLRPRPSPIRRSTGTPAPIPAPGPSSEAQGSLRGHWVVGVLVTPVQWDPATKALARRRARCESSSSSGRRRAAELALVSAADPRRAGDRSRSSRPARRSSCADSSPRHPHRVAGCERRGRGRRARGRISRASGRPPTAARSST